MLRFFLHYGMHFMLPFLIGFLFFKSNRLQISLLLLSGILIDIDHLLAVPVFDPMRCSLNFHPLHSYWAILVYAILFLFKKTRILGLALLIHILADLVDCYLIFVQTK